MIGDGDSYGEEVSKEGETTSNDGTGELSWRREGSASSFLDILLVHLFR